MHRGAVVVGFVLLCAASANAATFFVTSNGDAADATPGDGTCATAGSVCTLRAAITEANAFAGSDTIMFSLTGAAPHVIQPVAALPTITGPLTIQGPSLVGDAAQVVIDGVNAGSSTTGLVVALGAGVGCDISGIGITRFTGPGIELDTGACTIESTVLTANNTGIAVLSGTAGIVIGSANPNLHNIIGSNVIAGIHLLPAAASVSIRNNLIGVNSSATAFAQPYGILVEAGNPVIDANTIAASSIGGIVVDGAAATASAQITNNKIGTDVSGSIAVGNLVGIRLSTAGSSTSVSGNTISASTAAAVIVENSSAAVTISANRMGTDSLGQSAPAMQNQRGVIVQSSAVNTTIVGNTIVNSSQFGIDVDASAGTGTKIINNVLGRDATFSPAPNNVAIRLSSQRSVVVGGVSAGNTIVNSTQEGILTVFGVNVFTQNSIHDNGALGINVGNTGPSQQYPVLAAANTYNGTTYVRGTVQGPASSNVDVEVYANAACDPSGFGEGETLIGTATVTTDAAGAGAFLIPSAPYSPGTPITATATSTIGTSSFSACLSATSCAAFSISPTSAPAGVVGTLYSQAYTVGGVTAGYTFTTTGTLPPGVTMASNGVLSGTPTQAGTYNVRIIATNQNGCGSYFDTAIKICPLIAIDPPTIPDGTTQTHYNVMFAASGGSSPYTYSLSGGGVGGLTLDAATGAYTGTPGTFSTFSFNVIATDANSCAGSQHYTVNISLCDVTIRPAVLPMPMTGTPYDVTLTTVGTTGAITYAVTQGTLPAGVSLIADHLMGTPTTLGPSTFTIQGTAADGCVGSRGFDITTSCGALEISPASVDAATEGDAYAMQLTATGGSAPYTFAASNLPPGLSISPSGEVTGTPTLAVEQMVAVMVTDAMGCTSNRIYTFSVGPAANGGCCDSSSAPPATSFLLGLLVLVRLRRRQ